MQYAIVSDIHSNLQAWNATLLDIRSLGIEEIICLGDLVGYGPDPVAVLKSVHANVHHIVLGNHDAVICNKMNASHFNDGAQEIIHWTMGQLGRNAIKFLKDLPLSLVGDGFRCAHGDLANPAMFDYILDPQDALPSWNTVEDQLLFVGHTHHPAIFLLGDSGTPHVVEPQDFAMEEGKRFIVNAGSIGQPRNGDTRACYVIFDTTQRSIHWRQIPFDIDAYGQALRRAGIPAEPSYFLRQDPRADIPPIRELLDFSPATTPDEAVSDTVPVQQVAVLRRSVRTWKLLSTAIILTLLALSATAFSVWWRHSHRALTIADPSSMPLAASRFGFDENMLSLPNRHRKPGSYIPGWHIQLGDHRVQSVSVQIERNIPGLVLVSRDPNEEIVIASPTIKAEPGMKFCIEALFLKDKTFTGSIACVVVLRKAGTDPSSTVHRFVVKEPNAPRGDGWARAKKTFEAPARTTEFIFQIRGKFTGEVKIRDVGFRRRP